MPLVQSCQMRVAAECSACLPGVCCWCRVLLMCSYAELRHKLSCRYWRHLYCMIALQNCIQGIVCRVGRGRCSAEPLLLICVCVDHACRLLKALRTTLPYLCAPARCRAHTQQ